MKDPVYNDNRETYRLSDPEDRKRFIDAEPPPPIAEQLDSIEAALDDLDEHDRTDMKQALDRVRFYREHLSKHYLNEKPHGPDIVYQLIAAASNFGAAHQRAFDRRPLSHQVKIARARKEQTGPKGAQARRGKNAAFEDKYRYEWARRMSEQWKAGVRNHRKAAAAVSDEMQRETGDPRHSEQRIYLATAEAWKSLKEGRFRTR